MSMHWKLKYGSAAVLLATVIISLSLITNPTLFPKANAVPFAVLLTDPPIVPDGTTGLNMTYSDLSLHVIYPDEKVEWLSVQAQGTVDLLSLVNMTKTIASTTLPANSAIDQIQFTIKQVNAMVNDKLYTVATVSDTLQIRVVDGKINQTAAAALIDFNPTLIQIDGFDANGTTQNYYVLVPSVTATVVGKLSEEQLHEGNIAKLTDEHEQELEEAEDEELTNAVTVTSATLSVTGDMTSLSVTLKNEGTQATRIFAVTLQGRFNPTTHGHEDDQGNDHQTIPFSIAATSLTPILKSDHEDEQQHAPAKGVTLQPGQTITLSFSGVIQLPQENNEDGDGHTTAAVVKPIAGNTYTLRVMGEGTKTSTITATT